VEGARQVVEGLLDHLLVDLGGQAHQLVEGAVVGEEDDPLDGRALLGGQRPALGGDFGFVHALTLQLCGHSTLLARPS
jgi:hypothetical protein